MAPCAIAVPAQAVELAQHRDVKARHHHSSLPLMPNLTELSIDFGPRVMQRQSHPLGMRLAAPETYARPCQEASMQKRHNSQKYRALSGYHFK